MVQVLICLLEKSKFKAVYDKLLAHNDHYDNYSESFLEDSVIHKCLQNLQKSICQHLHSRMTITF